jgi:hypothetical protein
MTTGSSSCEDTERALYTVKSGDNTFVLTPDRGTGAKAGALLSMGWSTVFAKNSVLANRLPGTVLLLRGDVSLLTGHTAALKPGLAHSDVSLQPPSAGR